ncbi:MAG: methyltransferase domain-containing protein [Deltaproteobacteria bacterium]|nr:MAG: methyltransferase domain-containing protein [Deltaproteobacteria bacterium]
MVDRRRKPYHTPPRETAVRGLSDREQPNAAQRRPLFVRLRQASSCVRNRSRSWLTSLAIRRGLRPDIRRVNLCSGSQRLPGYCNIDLDPAADLMLDLASGPLPFPSGSLDVVACISGINYFTRARARALVRETHRVLRRGGVARFSSQDMEAIARRYVERDVAWFEQRLPNGRFRFEGPTLGDRFAAWFYGYETAGGPCRYFYDYESLAYLFREAGFGTVERRGYRDSRLDDVALLDNRPEQVFFLEAVK